MNSNQISDLYRVIGWLEGITMLPEGMIHGSVKAVLIDCVDKLEILGGDMLAKEADKHEKAKETARME